MADNALWAWLRNLFFRVEEQESIAEEPTEADRLRRRQALLDEGIVLDPEGEILFRIPKTEETIKARWQKLKPREVTWTFEYQGKRLALVKAEPHKVFQLLSPWQIEHPGRNRHCKITSSSPHRSTVTLSMTSLGNVYDTYRTSESLTFDLAACQVIWSGLRHDVKRGTPHVE